MSPDAYIQMALQLAYYRDANEFALTYGTASLSNAEGGERGGGVGLGGTGVVGRQTKTLIDGRWIPPFSRLE